MIQVSVSNSANNGSWGGIFPDSNTANSWISDCETKGLWGSPAQAAVNAEAASYTGIPAGCSTSITLTANTAGTNGNTSLQTDGQTNLTTLVNNWNTANSSNQVSLTGDGTQVPALGSITLANGINATPAVPGYIITQTDISAQVANQAAIQKGLQCQQFGATVIAQVYAYNETNLESGALTSAQFTTMLADITLSNIERCLWNGSLNTALSLINGYSTTLQTYFSSAQLSTITNMIQNSGLL